MTPRLLRSLWKCELKEVTMSQPPPILPGSVVKHRPSGQTWVVYACDGDGFYPVVQSDGYCRIQEVDIVARTTPHQALRFLTDNPTPKGDGPRAKLARENRKFLVLYLAEPDEVTRLFDTISCVTRAEHAFTVAQMQLAAAREDLEETIQATRLRILESAEK